MPWELAFLWSNQGPFPRPDQKISSLRSKEIFDWGKKKKANQTREKERENIRGRKIWLSPHGVRENIKN